MKLKVGSVEVKVEDIWKTKKQREKIKNKKKVKYGLEIQLVGQCA